MNLLLKILLPVLVLVGSVFASKTVFENRPEPFQRPQFPRSLAVDATRLVAKDYPVKLRSQGTIRATQSTTLVSEVNGIIIDISPAFVVGGSFSAGETLLKIDDRDYVIALTQANANLAQADASLQEERARSELAKIEWESLGNGRKAPAFTLRIPQLAAARASRDAARAQVERAQLDLDRTNIVAQYDGQTLEKQADLGQFVSRGTPLGRIYSTASVDVRLPLSDRQLTFLDIPASVDDALSANPNVVLTSTSGGTAQTWEGKLVRAEGVDTATQQLNVIVRVESPFTDGKKQLRIGQYVEASITGQTLKDVYVLPRAAVRENNEVLIVNDDKQLERRIVEIAWLDKTHAAVNEGLSEGLILVTTPLSTVTNGTPVRATVDGVAPPPLKRPQGGAGRGGKAGAREGKPGGQGKPDGQQGKRNGQAKPDNQQDKRGGQGKIDRPRDKGAEQPQKPNQTRPNASETSTSKEQATQQESGARAQPVQRVGASGPGIKKAEQNDADTSQSRSSDNTVAPMKFSRDS